MKDDKGKKSSDSTGNDSLKHSQSKLVWLFGTIFSVLIAIGAYSKDSLFVRYVMPSKTFSVVRSTSLGGSANSGIYRAYQTKYGELLAPVQIMLYLNIRNESEEPQTIEGVLLEFQGQDGRWNPITVLSTGSGIYTDFGRTKLKKAILLDIRSISLTANLGSASLAPHEVVSGWLFLEFPEQFRQNIMLKNPLRITICSGFGDREIHEIKDVDLPSNAAQTRAAFLKVTSTERDISQLSILAEGDLMKRLDEDRKKLKED